MHLRHLTFRLLQVFADVVATGSISATAQRLHLTQPTVSQQLKRLREAVGEPLLMQQDRRQVPTEVGLVLYRLAQDVLSRADAFNQTLADHRSGKRGHFSIALVSTAQSVLPRLLGPFSKAFPNADVTVEIGNREQILRRFDRHEDDLYIFSHPPLDSDVRAVPFLRNPLILITSAQSQWAQRTNIDLLELTNERFLLREPGSATRHLFDNWLQGQGMTLPTTLQIASNEAIRESVAAGMGCAVLSKHIIPSHDTRIVTLTAEGFPLESHWQFVMRHGRQLPPVARHFLDTCQNLLPTLFPDEFIDSPTNLSDGLTEA